MRDKPSDEAFNRGCDDRWAGRPLDANPYKSHGEAENSDYSFWRYGWFDMEAHWAKWVRGRWEVRVLPKVMDGHSRLDHTLGSSRNGHVGLKDGGHDV